MRSGLKKIAIFFSQKCYLFGASADEIDQAWQEWDDEEDLMIAEEKRWRESMPNAQERIRGFIEEGSITEAQVENYRQKYLKERFEEQIRDFHEKGVAEYPKELKKIVSEYKFRFEGGKGITEQEIELARNTPIEKFIETKKGFILCPFHKEKTPSMKVNRNLYKCFGCNAGGDTIRFIEQTQNLKFPQAVKYILKQ